MSTTERFRVVAQLDAGVEEAFELISGAEGMRRWVPLCRSVEYRHPAGASGITAGSVRDVVLRVGLTAVEEIRLYDPPRALTYTLISAGIRMDRLVQDYLGVTTLEPLDANRCRLTWTIHYECVGRMRAFEPLIRAALRATIGKLVRNICGITGGKLERVR